MGDISEDSSQCVDPFVYPLIYRLTFTVHSPKIDRGKSENGQGDRLSTVQCQEGEIPVFVSIAFFSPVISATMESRLRIVVAVTPF